SMPVAISKNAIRHGEGFSSLNIHFQLRDVTHLKSAGYYKNLKELENLKAKGWIPAGTILQSANTLLPYAVTSGTPVELINEQSGFTIRALVRALENGRASEWVRVFNPASKKIILARVHGPNEVRLK
ncbi:MAG: flagellar basal body P-ring formation protein FlgA, partial [Deltaproteobacteria bacterium]|nr:flagellar basal body P-ring formation protein FlgA [Deltaproteobacteria bacterium]